MDFVIPGFRHPCPNKAPCESPRTPCIGKVNYVLEGNLNYTGAVITWLKDDMKLISSPGETQKLAEEASKDDKTYLVPAFSGLGAPYWDSRATAAVVGMTRTTKKPELEKAAVECIAYQITDIVMP